uniref:Uncharacterized protein n=1 Tax=Leersia perrieri TaxID=77586 RepID=A0A0D9WU81_9ORYZ
MPASLRLVTACCRHREFCDLRPGAIAAVAPRPIPSRWCVPSQNRNLGCFSWLKPRSKGLSERDDV